ncbi:MAG: hypothetical protein ACRDMV_19145 [Streptosporangiales bacterium]
MAWSFLYLIFLPITAIPDYAITDLGLIDCVKLEPTSPVIGPVDRDKETDNGLW